MSHAELPLPTLSRHVAATAYDHELAVATSPATARRSGRCWTGSGAPRGKPVQKAPAGRAHHDDGFKAIPDGERGKRDRALLTLGFTGAFRQSELVVLDITDLVFEADGARADAALQTD